MELANEMWFEEARQNLEESCERGDWDTARNIIIDTEGKGFSVVGMRRYMNLAMDNSDDFEYVTYEHPTAPTITASEMDAPIRERHDEHMDKFIQKGEENFLREIQG